MLGVGLFMIYTASKDMTTYATFEIASEKGSRVKIAGELAKDMELNYDPIKDPNYFSFYLNDPKGNQRKVILTQAKPRDFELSEQVVVTGSMNEDVFVADEVLIKCPSKYKDEEIALRNKG